MISAGGAALGLAEFVHKTGEVGEQLGLASQRLGINVEALQGLQYAAKLANVSSEDLTHTLGFMNRALFNAQHGSGEALMAFQRLGINWEHLIGLKPEQAFSAIAGGLQRLRDPAARSAIAMQLFGRSGQQLIPVLAKGPAYLREMAEEAKSFGEYTEGDVEAATAYSESIKRLGGVLTGIRRAVGIGFLPIFREAADAVRKFLVTNREIIKENLTGFVAGLVAYLKVVFRVMQTVLGAFAGFIAHLHGAKLATELLLGTMGLLSGVGILAALGKTVMLIKEIGVAMAAVDAEALLIPLLIGLAIAAIGLIAEDVVAFFQGRDSLTGRIVAALKESYPEIYNFLQLVGGAIASLVKFVAPYIKEGLVFQFENLVIVLKGLASAASFAFTTILQSISDTIVMVKAMISGFESAWEWVKKVGSFAGFGANAFAGAQQAVAGAQSFASPSAYAAPQAAGGSSGVRDVNTSIQVTVPPGTPPGEVGPRVERGVQKGLLESLRQATRVNASGVAY